MDKVSSSGTNPVPDGSNPVYLSVSKVWQPRDTIANRGTVVSTSSRSQSIGVANPSTTLNGSGNWTTTSIAPDVTKQHLKSKGGFGHQCHF